jgi:hypothetical protein
MMSRDPRIGFQGPLAGFLAIRVMYQSSAKLRDLWSSIDQIVEALIYPYP